MKPAVLIYFSFDDEQAIKEICAGIEEEGVPFEVVKLDENLGAFELSKLAANTSVLEVGIGVDKEKVCIYCTALKTDTPLVEAELKDKKVLRIIGSNSARYVKKVPFK